MHGSNSSSLRRQELDTDPAAQGCGRSSIPDVGQVSSCAMRKQHALFMCVFYHPCGEFVVLGTEGPLRIYLVRITVDSSVL